MQRAGGTSCLLDFFANKKDQKGWHMFEQLEGSRCLRIWGAVQSPNPFLLPFLSLTAWFFANGGHGVVTCQNQKRQKAAGEETCLE